MGRSSPCRWMSRTAPEDAMVLLIFRIADLTPACFVMKRCLYIESVRKRSLRRLMAAEREMAVKWSCALTAATFLVCSSQPRAITRRPSQIRSSEQGMPPPIIDRFPIAFQPRKLQSLSLNLPQAAQCPNLSPGRQGGPEPLLETPRDNQHGPSHAYVYMMLIGHMAPCGSFDDQAWSCFRDSKLALPQQALGK